MRTFGSILAGAAIAALLLSGTAITVLAQDEEPSSGTDDFVYVSGQEVNGTCGGDRCTARQVMSDPRVTGSLDVQLDLGCSEETICWMGGELTLTNDDGAWEGRWVGFINDDGQGVSSHDIMQWLEGSGAYEGWSYVAVLSDLDRPGTQVRGVLYRGDLPPSVAREAVPAAESSTTPESVS